MIIPRNPGNIFGGRPLIDLVNTFTKSDIDFSRPKAATGIPGEWVLYHRLEGLKQDMGQ
jgi:hypothetical protein